MSRLSDMGLQVANNHETEPMNRVAHPFAPLRKGGLSHAAERDRSSSPHRYA